MPARRIEPACAWAAPVVQHIHRHLARQESPRAAVRRDEGAAGYWLQAAILAADLEPHQLAAITELQAEPIPADCPRPERRSAPLMIEPAFAGDGLNAAVRQGD